MITRSSTNLIIKALQDTDTDKSKTSETSGLHLYALLSSNSSYPKLVFVKLPDRMSRWSFELACALKVPIFVRVLFNPSVRNLDLQSGVCYITYKEKFLK